MQSDTQKLTLTGYGQAVTKTGLTIPTARALRKILKDSVELTGSRDDMIRYCVRFLNLLAHVPEQVNRDLGNAGAADKNRPVVRPDEMDHTIRNWIEAKPQAEAFASTPQRRRAKRNPTAQQWLTGEGESDFWDSKFDRYVTFIEEALATFLPHILTAAHYLAEHDNLPPRPWKLWALYLELGVDSSQAAALLQGEVTRDRQTAREAGLTVRTHEREHQSADPAILLRALQNDGINTVSAQRIADWHTGRSTSQASTTEGAARESRQEPT